MKWRLRSPWQPLYIVPFVVGWAVCMAIDRPGLAIIFGCLWLATAVVVGVVVAFDMRHGREG